MPRVAKSSRYTQDKQKAVNALSKVELTEQIEQKKSDLKEVQDNMTIHANNVGTHNPKELQHKSARYNELKQVRDTVTEDISILSSELNSIRNPQPEKRESVLNAGISINDNPFDENREDRTPITFEGNEEGWSISGNPNFITGTNSFSFDGVDDREILRRRQGRSQNNMASIVDPKLKPKLQVAGRKSELTNEQYQRYQDEEKRIIHNEGLVARQIENDRLAQHRGLTPIQYAHAEAQGSNPVTEAMSLIDQTSRGFEGISESGVQQQNFRQANNDVNQLQTAFQNNLSLAIINPINEFTQGSQNVIGSYLNLASNIANTVQGKPQKALPEDKTPVTDSLFGAVQTGIADSFSYNVPLAVSMSDSWDNFLKTQSQRSPYTIAGEIATEAAIVSIPIPLTKALSATKFGLTRLFGRNEIKGIAEIINPFKASTKNPKALEKTKNASESILLQGSETTATYFPANVIKSTGRRFGKKKDYGHTTSYSDPEIIKSLGLTHLKEIRLLGKPEKQLQKDLGLKKVKNDYYKSENPDINQLHQFGIATETKNIKPVAVGRKFSNVEIMKYKKSFSQFYNDPTNAAVPKPISDTAIFVTKDYGLTRNPILSLNYYLKNVIPKSQKTNKVNKKSFDQTPENKPNSQTIEIPKANKVTTKQKEIKDVVKKVQRYDNQPKQTGYRGIAVSTGLTATAKGITAQDFKLETNPQMINSQVVSGAVGLAEKLNFDFITGIKQQQQQNTALKLITPTRQLTNVFSGEIHGFKPIQTLIPIQKPITELRPIVTPVSAIKPWLPIPWFVNDEKKRRRRRRKGKRVQKKKADWHTPEQTPFKVLAGSGNYQYWGNKSDSKQLGRGWY